MTSLLLVGAGGFAGSVCRWLVSRAALAWPHQGKFPLATFAVNIAGCLLIGLAAAALERCKLSDSPLKLLVIPGFLGGFTTFSAFGLETAGMLQRGAWGWAALYSMASVFCGVAAVAAGMALLKE